MNTTVNRDFVCAKNVWSGPGILGASGAVIFLTYLSLPALTRVPVGGGERIAGTLGAEHQFMARLVGLCDDAGWDGGIDNPRVYSMVIDTARRHRRYPGMTPAYMDLMATVIASAPLRVRAVRSMPVAASTQAGYWRYMRRAMRLFDCSLPGQQSAENMIRSYAALNARPSERGAKLLNLIIQTYPQYIAAGIPALVPECTRVVRKLLGENQ